jgi:uncharacterized protein YciI
MTEFESYLSALPVSGLLRHRINNFMSGLVMSVECLKREGHPRATSLEAANAQFMTDINTVMDAVDAMETEVLQEREMAAK